MNFQLFPLEKSVLRGREDILAIYCLLFEIYPSPILSTFFSKSHQHYSDDDDSVYEFTEKHMRSFMCSQ